ncbi:MAG: lipid-A-disaccharide synthase, partial [Proteobacteria bacterium]|nr:lipid-A-disaccharide synthase [Pseudomonadota bacterium]
MSLDIFFSCGEASSDAHGAALFRAIRKRHGNVHGFGMGSRELAAEGMDIRANASNLNIVGLFDWIGKAGGVLRAYRDLIKAVDKRKPDCAVLMDLPDFNLFLARQLKRRGIPVVYYISPQVWAWRKNRVHKLRRCVDKMLVVFPFEKAFYERAGVPVEFVGHPLLDRVRVRGSYRPQHEVVAAPRLAVLPGSRRGELKYHRELVNKLLKRLWAEYPTMEVRMPVASTVDLACMKALFPDKRILFQEAAATEAMEWADLAVIASGTATLEAALVGTPSLLFYRVGKATAFIYHNVARYRG